jgi:hypothetical protein
VKLHFSYPVYAFIVYRGGNPTLLAVFRQLKQTCRISRGGTLIKECFFICNRIEGQHDRKSKKHGSGVAYFNIYILSELPLGRNRKVNAICHEPAVDVLRIGRTL